jgi:hypothetical protein
MADMSCASCHVPTSQFADGQSHHIGSKDGADGESTAGAFETPTLLNVLYTAPYFHDGSLDTLSDVVEWFDTRNELDLTEGETADLTAFVEAVGAAEMPYETFDETNTRFRMAWEELTTFASTLDLLLPARDAFHATLAIRTVAPDLAEEGEEAATPQAEEAASALSEGLWEIHDAIEAQDWPEAERLWTEWSEAADERDPIMR